MKNSNKFFIIGIFAILFLFLLPNTLAKNSCSRDGCEITITINMVASGGNQETIDNWINDIEDVWNGPVQGDGASPTYGECKCPVNFEVNFSGFVTTCNGTSGKYHCIEITPEAAKDEAGETYRGYMDGVSNNGSSLRGWWSSSMMNTPVRVGDETFDTVHDAAHEAGHMLGLDDDYDKETGRYGNNIMGRTWGDDARPTQEQINKAVENNCKEEERKCPDECCCPNGNIDKNKDEECDPLASPQGCGKNEDCGFDCKCIKRPFCGDGNISEEIGEECEPDAKPTGCKEDEECTEECLCEKKQENITINITSPPNNAKISGEETVRTAVSSVEKIEKVKFFLDDEPQYTDYSLPYSWTFDSRSFDPGEYVLKVIAYSISGNTAEDEIEITIEEQNESDDGGGGGGGSNRDNITVCGNGECAFESGENCLNCPQDCVCEGICNPEDEMADEIGCVYAEIACGNGLCEPQNFENCLTCVSDCICIPPYLCDPENAYADLMGCYEPLPPTAG